MKLEFVLCIIILAFVFVVTQPGVWQHGKSGLLNVGV
jgi:hypothetical protein